MIRSRIRLARRLVAPLTVLAVLWTACEGAPGPGVPSAEPTPPPPALPPFESDPPGRAECFAPEAGPLGVPGFVPVPRGVRVQGPDEYAGPYRPLGALGRRIAGRGFAYVVSSRVGLVAGFYATCLSHYLHGRGWKRLLAEDNDVLFRIPLQGRPDVVVLIAEDPEGPSAVVVFTDYTLTAEPPPPATEGASPAQSPG